MSVHEPTPPTDLTQFVAEAHGIDTRLWHATCKQFVPGFGGPATVHRLLTAATNHVCPPVGVGEVARTTPKYPQAFVQLSGQDGNALAILGRTRMGLRAAGCPVDRLEAFTDEAMSGTYDHLLATVARWVTVDEDDPEEGDDE